MMKKVLLLFLTSLLCAVSYANPVGQSRARAVAQAFWLKHANTGKTPVFIECGANLGLEYVYIFNIKDGDGYVIVSGDDVANPIIGYSTETSWYTGASPAGAAFPDHILGWIRHYDEEISAAVKRGVSQSSEARNAWAEIEGTVQAISPKAPGSKVVNRLMVTQWNQSSPYNNLCPVDTGGRAVSGCVATAMAQIMRYWSWPPTGTGSHSYTCTTLAEPRELTVDFSAATYDWENMPAGGNGVYYLKRG